MVIETLVGQGTGASPVTPLCVGPCVSLRVHIIANGTPTGSVVVKQGETNVDADMKTIQTVSNPANGDNWITLQPSDWISVSSNLSVGSLKKVVIAWVPEND